MSRNQWILVEWVDERNVFTSYGVVNSNSLVNEDNDLHPGKMTFVRSKHGNSARRAQILRVSDDKRLVKEHKILLERQDYQVKNMLSMCMQTIKEMKTDPFLYGSMNASTSQPIKHEASGSGSGSGGGAAGGVAYRMVNHDDSDSASDEEITDNTKNLKISQPPVKTPTQFKKITDHFSPAHNSVTPNVNLAPKQRVITTSTPMVAEYRQSKEPKLTFDQATQTDDTLEVPAEKVMRIENILSRLHQQFLNLVSGLQLDNVPVEDDNDDEEQNIAPQHVEELVLEQVPNNSLEIQQLNDSNAEVQIPHSNTKALHVRRVSAHTTNNVEQSFSRTTPVDRNEMVAIGSGSAMVPARVLQDIDWGSYTGATRQLLQAIFPRKVLATSSLTGKPSPAFANVPAKRCLNPEIVHDIVDCVSQRCNVPKRSVRTCITIKCTDEAKLYRSRMAKGSRQNILSKQANRENLPPSPASNQSLD